MLNALRLREGFDREQFEARTGLAISWIAAHIDAATERGLLEQAGENALQDAAAFQTVHRRGITRHPDPLAWSACRMKIPTVSDPDTLTSRVLVQGDPVRRVVLGGHTSSLSRS